jgi:hypothetical protein
MVFIYVLKLQEEKYYIGKTDNPQFRLENHFNCNGSGSAWTQKYKPLKILKLIPNCNHYDEDKYTRQYMDKYGIANVRGGSFVKINLDKSTIDLLQHMSNSTNNKCFICGEAGHFAKNCVISKNNNTHEESDGWETCSEEDEDEEEEEEEDDEEEEEEEINCCFRCGRVGHYSPSCYASKHIKGYYLKK